MSERKGPGGETRVMTAFRILPADLAEIDRRADRLRMTRTDFVIRACLGLLPNDVETDGRLDELERRVDKLDDFAFGG